MTFPGETPRDPRRSWPDDGPQDRLPSDDAGDPRMVAGPRGRFGVFPFPNYTTTTRGGTQVSVGGCCLPIPLGCLTVLACAAAAAVAAQRR